MSGLWDEGIFSLWDYFKSKTFKNAEMQKREYLGMVVYFSCKDYLESRTLQNAGMKEQNSKSQALRI